MLAAEASTDGAGLKLRWATDGARYVEIDGLRYPRRGRVTIAARPGRPVRVTAISAPGGRSCTARACLTPGFGVDLPQVAVQHPLAPRPRQITAGLATAPAADLIRRLSQVRVPRLRARQLPPLTRLAPASSRMPTLAAATVAARPDEKDEKGHWEIH